MCRYRSDRGVSLDPVTSITRDISLCPTKKVISKCTIGYCISIFRDITCDTATLLP